MIKTAFQLALVSVWFIQATPVRTGDVARQLSLEDIAAIQRVLPSSAKPWLLNGDPSVAAGFEAIEAYLPPTIMTPPLRHGTVINIHRQTRPTVGPWTAQGMRSYVQVAVPDRSFDDIRGDQDVNRPFNVIDVFDDDALVRLIAFLRSDPPVQGGHVQPWPILSVQRKADDSVTVLLRETALQGQSLTLRQVKKEWVIVSAAWWAN